MRKKVITVFIGLIAIAGFINNYAYKCVVDAFHISGSKKITEAAAPELLNTIQNYNFNLINVSGKTVKLQEIRLEDYKGIKIGSLTVEGKPFQAQDAPSSRTYSSPTASSTSSQGILFQYDVTILEPVIQNPKKVIVTYSYFGIKHTQVLDMP